MSTRAIVVGLGMSLAFGATLSAQQPSGQTLPQPSRKNALDEYLIPPDFIMQHDARLRLSQQQRTAIEAEKQQLEKQVPSLQTQLQKEVATMEDLLKKEVRDEAVVLGQLDRLLDGERQIKRLQLAALLRVRNQLTGQQLAEMNKIREEMIAKRRQLEQRLNAKLRRVQQLLQQRAQAGRPPNEVIRQMQEFPKLMQQGKTQEAEAVVDNALRQLGGP